MYWIRVVIMVFVLAAVVWTIRFLNGPVQSQNPFATVAPERGVKPNLCPTRIAAVTTADGLRLEQRDGTQWLRTKGGMSAPGEELDPIAVEKWFSQFCTLTLTEPAPTPSQGEFTQALTITYITGKTEILSQARVTANNSSTNKYQFEAQEFQAPHLNGLLASLPTLPLVVHPGDQHP